MSEVNIVFDGGRAMAVDRLSPPDGFAWMGRITPVSKDRLWIQMRSAYGSKHVETEVDADGEFRIYHSFAEGPYVLYVMNKDGRCIYLAPLDIVNSTPREPLIIKLPPAPPPVMIGK